jgi:hypothetical protein
MGDKEYTVSGKVISTSDDVFKTSRDYNMFYNDDKTVEQIMGNLDSKKKISNRLNYNYNGGLLQKDDQLEFLYREEDLKNEKIIKVTGKLKNFLIYDGVTSGSSLYGIVLDECSSPDSGIIYDDDDSTCKSIIDNNTQIKSKLSFKHKVFYFNRIVITSLKAVRNHERILLPGNYVNLNIIADGSFLNTDALIMNINIKDNSIIIQPILYKYTDTQNKNFIVTSLPNNYKIRTYTITNDLILNIILNNNDNIIDELKNINILINSLYTNNNNKGILSENDDIKKLIKELIKDAQIYLFNTEQSEKYEKSQKTSTTTPKIPEKQTAAAAAAAEEEAAAAAAEKAVNDAKAQQYKELTNNLALVAKSDDSEANKLIDDITKIAFKIAVPPETNDNIKSAIKELLPDDKFQFTNNKTLKALPDNLANFYVQQFEKMSSIYAETEKDLLLWSDEKTKDANQKLFSQLKYINKVDKLHTDLFGKDTSQKLTPSQINFFLSLKDNTSDKLIKFIKARWNDEIIDDKRHYNIVITNDSKLQIDNETNDFFKALQIIDNKYSEFDNNNLTNALFITFSYFQKDKNGNEKRDRSSSGVGKIIRYDHRQGEFPSEMILLLQDGTLKSTYKLKENYSKTFTINIRDKDDGIELYWAPIITRRVFAPLSKTKRFLGKTGNAIGKITKGIRKIKLFSSKNGGTMKKYPHKITKKNRK